MPSAQSRRLYVTELGTFKELGPEFAEYKGTDRIKFFGDEALAYIVMDSSFNTESSKLGEEFPLVVNAVLYQDSQEGEETQYRVGEGIIIRDLLSTSGTEHKLEPEGEQPIYLETVLEEVQGLMERTQAKIVTIQPETKAIFVCNGQPAPTEFYGSVTLVAHNRQIEPKKEIDVHYVQT